MDFVMKVQNLPEAGQTMVESRSYNYRPGGKGTDGAVSLARLGGDCIFCCRLRWD